MLSVEHILFVDIETVPLFSDYQQLTPEMQEYWKKKSKFLRSDQENPTESSLFWEKSAVFSEFAKVVCISIGCMVQKQGQWKILLKSLTAREEYELLQQFCVSVDRFSSQHKHMLFAGHNIREFDLPFLCRRMLINNIPLPPQLQLSGKKPWEIEHIDTLEMWKFGDYKHFTSLGLLAEVLGIPSPKEDIDGSMVAEVYWKQGDIARIAKYCMNDVLTSARVFLRLKNILDINPEPEFIF